MNKRKILAASVAAILALAGAGGTTASATSADGTLDGSGMSYGSGGWYGAYHIGSTVAFCGDLGSIGPSHADGWTTQTSGYTFYKQTQWSADADYPYPTSGNAATVADLAQMAYALDKYGSSAPDQSTGMALEHLVRLKTIDGTVQVNRENTRWNDIALNTVPSAGARYTAIAADAARNAGPYTAHVEWIDQPSNPGDVGTARAFIRTGSGQTLLNTPLAIAAAGGTLSTPSTVNTGSTGDAMIQVTVDDSGRIELAASVNGLPGIWPTLHVPTNRTDMVQRLMGLSRGSSTTLPPHRVMCRAGLWSGVVREAGPWKSDGQRTVFGPAAFLSGFPS